MRSSATTTGATPAPTGTAAHRHVPFSVTRRPAARAATAYRSTTNAGSAGTEPTTHPITRVTAPSWDAARIPAVAPMWPPEMRERRGPGRGDGQDGQDGAERDIDSQQHVPIRP
ncbi:hypothetical protein [Streptomyces sp. NPDC059209]|uniref:hypothetical protein n=1 Tax=Streptomyces sp. NPDC059209 TaxID=3346769 RepID=UPI003688CBCA